jgi:hypothetical protein
MRQIRLSVILPRHAIAEHPCSSTEARQDLALHGKRYPVGPATASRFAAGVGYPAPDINTR